MLHLLLTFLNHAISANLPLALQFSPLQLIAILLAALASNRALIQMNGKSAPALSAQIMLSVALLSIVLASNLGVSDDLHPAVDMALVIRLVIGGGLVSLWNVLHTRLKLLPIRS
ncbi:hypothetical protein Q0M94_20855 (plasmid) [Deinococcus radiomollis]|uniref:hypothetical protein n=1 Tax=Deinococcus radiomollis TaxID=468916 RepID=UPI003891DE07